MGKIAGIRGKSPEAYPPDNEGQPSISTQGVTNAGPLTSIASPFSLLPDGPIEAGGDGERIIVMFSGQLQWPNTEETGATSTVTVGIYMDGTLEYSIKALVLTAPFSPNPPEPVPFSLFWETPSTGAHEIDIKVQPSASTNVYAANNSL